ncbi:hypothetical protein R1sor_023722 [Riccia sorocarpa]|uniref:HMA domain-containing protein n=1 Tax=Riccia sorocarpa TaxID=122646 RepID=A0ABD3GPZ4_9MARC
MAMAAATATLPSFSLVACTSSSAGGALECRSSRVEFCAAAFPSARVSRDSSSRSHVWSSFSGSKASSSGRKEWRWQAVAEKMQAQAESDEGVEEAVSTDTLAMHFEAEGTIADTSIPKLTKTLEAVEGVSSVEVYVSEGGATVRLVKQMNVQATGVASGLVEIITKGGFKLQALNLGFDEDGDDDDDLYDYDTTSYTEEETAAAE